MSSHRLKLIYRKKKICKKNYVRLLCPVYPCAPLCAPLSCGHVWPLRLWALGPNLAWLLGPWTLGLGKETFFHFFWTLCSRFYPLCAAIRFSIQMIMQILQRGPLLYFNAFSLFLKFKTRIKADYANFDGNFGKGGKQWAIKRLFTNTTSR
jgi:hypothetical protein